MNRMASYARPGTLPCFIKSIMQFVTLQGLLCYRRSSVYCTPCIGATDPFIRGGSVRDGSDPMAFPELYAGKTFACDVPFGCASYMGCDRPFACCCWLSLARSSSISRCCSACSRRAAFSCFSKEPMYSIAKKH